MTWLFLGLFAGAISQGVFDHYVINRWSRQKTKEAYTVLTIVEKENQRLREQCSDETKIVVHTPIDKEQMDKLSEKLKEYGY